MYCRLLQGASTAADQHRRWAETFNWLHHLQLISRRRVATCYKVRYQNLFSVGDGLQSVTRCIIKLIGAATCYRVRHQNLFSVEDGLQSVTRCTGIINLIGAGANCYRMHRLLLVMHMVCNSYRVHP